MHHARQAPDLPPGYPSSYESVVRLDDGRRVQVRPILPSDAPEVAEAIRTADAETLHARFLGSAPMPTQATLDTLTLLDYVHRFALVARSRGRGVAIGRYETLPPDESGSVVAEIAVAVAPEWRRVGLATVLVESLARRAMECGITDFTALFLADNRPVVDLARDGGARVVIGEGTAQLHAPLATAVDTWPDRERPDEGRESQDPRRP